MEHYLNFHKSLIFFHSCCRSNKDQPAVCTKHSQHVCPCAWGVHRWAAHHNDWQVDESIHAFYLPWNRTRHRLNWFTPTISQVSGLCCGAGGVRRGDSRPGCGRSVHVHPPQSRFSGSDASRHHAVCGQVQPLQQSTSTQHFTNKWNFITHPQSSWFIHPDPLL